MLSDILERELIPQMHLDGLFCSKQGFCDLKNKSVLHVFDSASG